MTPDNQVNPNLMHPSSASRELPLPGDKGVPPEKGLPGYSPEAPAGAPGGIHNRPPIPGAEKAECPKFMSHGPCGGVRKGGYCEVFPEMMCPWVMMYFDLKKIGKLEWMTGA